MQRSLSITVPYGRLVSTGLVACLLLSTAHADLTLVNPAGFVVTYRQPVNATPAKAFEAIGQLPRWWSSAHSWSGDAANMQLPLQAGACFCEQWNGNSVEHGRVLMVMKDSMVRLGGALGPLQSMAVNGVLEIATGVSEGKTMLRLSYRVAGTAESGLDKLATPVDQVMGEQYRRLHSYIETGKPVPATPTAAEVK